METSQGQPIPFIELSERDEDNKTSLMVNPYAVSLLQEMKDKKVSYLPPLNSSRDSPYQVYFRWLSSLSQVLQPLENLSSQTEFLISLPSFLLALSAIIVYREEGFTLGTYNTPGTEGIHIHH